MVLGGREVVVGLLVVVVVGLLVVVVVVGLLVVVDLLVVGLLVVVVVLEVGLLSFSLLSAVRQDNLLQALLSLFPPTQPLPPFWAATSTRRTLI